jgi:hypothetical protein
MTYWPKHLWAGPPHWLGVSPLHFMYAVGVIEIAAGVLVLVLPRIAPYVVAAWLAGIVTNPARLRPHARRPGPGPSGLGVRAQALVRVTTGFVLAGGGPLFPNPERFLSLHDHTHPLTGRQSVNA